MGDRRRRSGGNALIADPEHQSYEDQFERMRITVHIADMIDEGWNLAITHGSGPQVACLLSAEMARNVIDETPMEVCVADAGIAGVHDPAATAQREAPGHGPGDRRHQADARDPAFQTPPSLWGRGTPRGGPPPGERRGWQVVEEGPGGGASWPPETGGDHRGGRHPDPRRAGDVVIAGAAVSPSSPTNAGA